MKKQRSRLIVAVLIVIIGIVLAAGEFVPLRALAYAEAAALLIHAPEAARVGLHGGVFTHNPLACELFTQALQARIPHAVTGMAEYPPELGALIHIFAKYGLVTEAVLKNLKNSYAAL